MQHATNLNDHLSPLTLYGHARDAMHLDAGALDGEYQMKIHTENGLLMCELRKLNWQKKKRIKTAAAAA